MSRSCVNSDKAIEVAVEVCIVRRSGSGPRGALHECSDNEECFARGGDDDSVLSAVRSLAAEFFADFAVNFGGDEDAAAGFGREIRQTGKPAGVVRFGEGQTAEDDFMNAFRGVADAGGREVDPCGGEVAAAVIGVFAGIAGDVGELEGDAEVDGGPTRGGIGGAEDAGHHESDGAGHAVRVAEEGALVGDERRAGVVAQGAAAAPGRRPGGGAL